MHLTYILNLKKLKLKFRTYIFTCYVLTKSFHKKSTYHVTCVKKTKFSAKNNAFHRDKFSLFYIDHKKYWFFVKLSECTYIMEIYM